MEPVPTCLRGEASPDRGLTMIEILVTLGILSVVIGSVLSIFVAGSRFGLRAQEKMEAGRVAQAVFDLVDRGFDAPSRMGRLDDGSLLDETVTCQQLASAGAQEIDGYQFRSLWAPTYVVRSPLSLVWKYVISPHDVDGLVMHHLDVTVRFDEDGDADFDDTDRLIARYSAILADR